jgi:hypothetical protein
MTLSGQTVGSTLSFVSAGRRAIGKQKRVSSLYQWEKCLPSGAQSLHYDCFLHIRIFVINAIM